MRSIVFALVLLFLPGHSFAENSCIRNGSGDVILTEVADCTAGFATFHRDAGWKFAYVEAAELNVGCWRTDGTFVHVQLDGQTTIHLASAVVSAESCPPPEARVRAGRWESAIEICEDISLLKKTARLACDAAMKLAEVFDESDPRFVRTLGGVSLQSEDPEESEALLRRSLAIYKKHFSGDFAAVMSTTAAIGYIRQRQPNWETSIPFYQEAIAVGRKHLGGENLEVIVNTLLFGKLYLDHGKLTEAKEWLLLALTGAESTKTAHWNMANNVAASCARFLADVYQAEGDLGEAERYRAIQRQHLQSPRSNEILTNEVEQRDAEES